MCIDSKLEQLNLFINSNVTFSDLPSEVPHWDMRPRTTSGISDRLPSDDGADGDCCLCGHDGSGGSALIINSLQRLWHCLSRNHLPPSSAKSPSNAAAVKHPATYGYHRRRLQRVAQGPGDRQPKRNLVSSVVHRNLLMLVLASFVPLLLLQGRTTRHLNKLRLIG